MNWKEQMAAYICASMLFAAFIIGGYRVDASIYAFRANNITRTFEDAISSFGPDVNFEKGYLYLGEPLDGCSDINPPKDLNGNFSYFNFVLLERGKCDFALKALNAQRAGYLAAIVYNVNSNDVIHMSSGLPEVVNKIYIPSVFVGQDTAKILNESYLHHESGNPYIQLVPNHFSVTDYLIPFVVVIGVCFISLLCFLCIRCMRDYRRTRRGRLSLQRLKKLPVKKFAKEDEYDVCAICLEDYDEGDVLRILPCHHAYHCKCVDPWLTSSKRICPLCKRKVLSDDESSITTGTSGDIADSSDDDENTPLVPQSEAASPNAPRYGTGYSLSNPFRSRSIGRRLLPSWLNRTSSDAPDLEANDDTPSTSAQSASRLSAMSNEYQSQDLSPPHPSDSEISKVMNSGNYNQVAADHYLDSAEAMLTNRSRMSESSIAVLSDEETEEASPEPPTCISTDYYTVDESIATARTPYNLESRLEASGDLNQEDIIVIATGSTTAVQDRRECALTCKKCYEASLDPALHWKSLYVFDAKAILSDDDLYFYCKSPNLFIDGLSENLHAKTLLNSEPSVLGPHVLKLSLKGSAILEGSFVDILKKCEFLEGLDISGCNSMFMPGNFLQNNERRSELAVVLRDLKDLNLSSIRYLDDKSLGTLISITPNIESLALASCNIFFSDFGTSQRHALTFPTILQLISSGSALSRIDLSRTGITNTALQTLASTEGVKLRELVLQNCREIGDSGIVGFVKRQRSLNVLDLRGCLELGNQALSAICANLQDLQELYICKCRKINDTSAVRLLSLNELAVLDISECYDITKSIHPILTSLLNLQHFIANGCNFTMLHEQIGSEEEKMNCLKIQPITNGFIDTRPVVDFSSLTRLSINSGKYVTDLTIQCIFKCLTNLEDLSMSWCHYITDRGLLGVDIDLSQLRTFPSVNIEKEFLDTGRYSTNHGRSGFLGAPGSEYKCLEDLSGSDMRASTLKKGIGRLKNLKRLALSNCRNVSSESLIRIFCVSEPIFPKLEHLDLNMMTESVTDDVLNGISFGCPLLTKLAISCSKVSDDGVEAVVRRLHRLELLDLSNCDYVTSRFFSVLIKNSKWLRELDISSCKQIPASSADKLRLSLPLLTRVHTRYSGI